MNIHFSLWIAPQLAGPVSLSASKPSWKKWWNVLFFYNSLCWFLLMKKIHCNFPNFICVSHTIVKSLVAFEEKMGKTAVLSNFCSLRLCLRNICGAKSVGLYSMLRVKCILWPSMCGPMLPLLRINRFFIAWPKILMESTQLIWTKCIYLADPGKARGCSISSLVINSFTESVSQPFPPPALRRRHAQTVRVCISTVIKKTMSSRIF